MLNKKPNLSLVGKSWEDIDTYVDDVKDICDSASEAIGGFFWADLASNPSWNLNLSKITF